MVPQSLYLPEQRTGSIWDTMGHLEYVTSCDEHAIRTTDAPRTTTSLVLLAINTAFVIYNIKTMYLVHISTIIITNLYIVFYKY